MNRKIKFTAILALLLLVSATGLYFFKEADHDDHDGHDHESSKAIGEGKAIVSVDEKLGFTLSPQAIETLKLKLQSIDQLIIDIPKKALVSAKEEKGVYLYRQGYFKLIHVKILTSTSSSYRVELESYQFADQLVIDGVSLLRVADIYSTDSSEYGHSH